jgi:gamma-glutamyltranspeptidase/glutathione hydrolase
MNSQRCTRRQMLLRTAALSGVTVPAILIRAADSPTPRTNGIVAGEPTAAGIGNQLLAQGGNAVDAAVAAALAACVVSPHNCGITGYGGHMVIASSGGKKRAAVDFNTVAPRAAAADMFAIDEHGLVRDRANEFGWLACGVPGTLAGLQLAIDRYATRSFAELVAPAIQLAQDGFPVGRGLANAIRSMAGRLRTDPGSAKLYFKDDEPYQAGDTFRNPGLAATLRALDNSAASFYRGAIAQEMADQFRRNDGLLTAKDLADYQAREAEPLRLDWDRTSIFTAPLAAGGVTVLQALSILKALKWSDQPGTPEHAHARVEAARVAWRDRLELLGDPGTARGPARHLLSRDYAREMAKIISAAVKRRQPVPIQVVSRDHGGTVHISSADRHGNLVALTLTQGNAFGACVTLEGLGLTLGHGLSRFEARPGHPNSIGPGKRPLHNMCPTVVSRDGNPHLALGGAGGRRIVNGVFDVLLRYVSGADLENAIAAPRLNTFGGLELQVGRDWPPAETEYLKRIGFKVATGPAANITAVWFDSQIGQYRHASR